MDEFFAIVIGLALLAIIIVIFLGIIHVFLEDGNTHWPDL